MSCSQSGQKDKKKFWPFDENWEKENFWKKILFTKWWNRFREMPPIAGSNQCRATIGNPYFGLSVFAKSWANYNSLSSLSIYLWHHMPKHCVASYQCCDVINSIFASLLFLRVQPLFSYFAPSLSFSFSLFVLVFEFQCLFFARNQQQPPPSPPPPHSPPILKPEVWLWLLES